MELRASHPHHRRLPTLAGLAVLLLVAAGLVMTTVPASSGANPRVEVAQSQQTNRPRPPRPTTSSTPTPTPTSTPTSTPHRPRPRPRRLLPRRPRRSHADPDLHARAGPCAGTTTHGGTTYCIGYIFGVRRTLYGVGTALALQSVAVTSVNGTVVGLSGGPSCLPEEWCGQTLPTASVTFPDGGPVPSYGDVINLYGITSTGSITTTEFDVVGHCDPYWGEC